MQRGASLSTDSQTAEELIRLKNNKALEYAVLRKWDMGVIKALVTKFEERKWEHDVLKLSIEHHNEVLFVEWFSLNRPKSLQQVQALWDLAISHLAGFAIDHLMKPSSSTSFSLASYNFHELLKSLQVDEAVLQLDAFDPPLASKLSYFLKQYLTVFMQDPAALVNLLKAGKAQFLARAEGEKAQILQRRFRYRFMEVLNKCRPEIVQEMGGYSEIARAHTEAEANQRANESRNADKSDSDSIEKARTLFNNHVDLSIKVAIEENVALPIIKALRRVFGAPIELVQQEGWDALTLACGSGVTTLELLKWLIEEEELPVSLIPLVFWHATIENINFPILTYLLRLNCPQFNLSALTAYLCKLDPTGENASKVVIIFDRLKEDFLNNPQLVIQLIRYCQKLSIDEQRRSSCYILAEGALSKPGLNEEEIVSFLESIDTVRALRYRVETFKNKAQWENLKTLCQHNLSAPGQGHDVSRAALAEGLLKGKLSLDEPIAVDETFQKAQATLEQKKAVQALYLLSACKQQNENLMNECYRLLSPLGTERPSDKTFAPNLNYCFVLYSLTKQNAHNPNFQGIIKNAGAHLLTNNFAPGTQVTVVQAPVYHGSLVGAKERAMESYRSSLKKS